MRRFNNPEVLYILASEFHSYFPTVLLPFKDEKYPNLVVTHQDNGNILVATNFDKVTLRPDDVLRCAQKHRGSISRILGPSGYYREPFRQIIAETNLSQKILVTNFDREVPCNMDQHNFGSSANDSPRNWNFDDNDHDVNMVGPRSGRGGFNMIYTRTGAEKAESNLTFLRLMLADRSRKPSGAFRAYEVAEEIRIDSILAETQSEIDAENTRREIAQQEFLERKERNDAKRLIELKEFMLSCGKNSYDLKGKTYFVHNGSFYRGAISKKHKIDWQDAFDSRLLEEIVSNVNSPTAQAVGN